MRKTLVCHRHGASAFSTNAAILDLNLRLVQTLEAAVLDLSFRSFIPSPTSVVLP